MMEAMSLGTSFQPTRTQRYRVVKTSQPEYLESVLHGMIDRKQDPCIMGSPALDPKSGAVWVIIQYWDNIQTPGADFEP